MAIPGTLALHRTRTDCRLCHATRLQLVVPLQPIPVRTPNMGRSTQDPGELDQAWVPLDLYRCEACGLLQLLDIVDPKLQYTNFRYRTSISLGLPEHFQRMAAEVVERLGLSSAARVLELGSNDGTLLACFDQLGLEVLGIDPAEEIAAQACAAGIPTLASFFHSQAAKEVRREHGVFDLVLANNTLANIDDLDDFLLGVEAVLGEQGVFVVETADGAAVVHGNLLDTIYHEHLCYFLVAPLCAWFARQGFQLFHVERVSSKGGSLRLFAQKRQGTREVDASVQRALEQEAAAELGASATYARLSNDLKHSRDQLHALIQTQRAAGRSIAAYGASVGTITLLHQFGLAGELDFIVDDQPLAAVLEGPGYAIPIVSGEHLREHPAGLVVILAHRYREAILARHEQYLRAGGLFAIPLPTLELVGQEA